MWSIFAWVWTKQGKYLDLSRFLDTLLVEGQEEQVPTLIVNGAGWSNGDDDSSPNNFNYILPDNGKIYGHIKQQSGRDLEVELWGVGGKVSFFYTDYQQKSGLET